MYILICIVVVAYGICFRNFKRQLSQTVVNLQSLEEENSIVRKKIVLLTSYRLLASKLLASHGVPSKLFRWSDMVILEADISGIAFCVAPGMNKANLKFNPLRYAFILFTLPMLFLPHKWKGWCRLNVAASTAKEIAHRKDKPVIVVPNKSAISRMRFVREDIVELVQDKLLAHEIYHALCYLHRGRPVRSFMELFREECGAYRNMGLKGIKVYLFSMYSCCIGGWFRQESKASKNMRKVVHWLEV